MVYEEVVIFWLCFVVANQLYSKSYLQCGCHGYVSESGTHVLEKERFRNATAFIARVEKNNLVTPENFLWRRFCLFCVYLLSLVNSLTPKGIQCFAHFRASYLIGKMKNGSTKTMYLSVFGCAFSISGVQFSFLCIRKRIWQILMKSTEKLDTIFYFFFFLVTRV